jgi:hypothetical protein
MDVIRQSADKFYLVEEILAWKSYPNIIAKELKVNSQANSHRFTSQLFTMDLAQKYSAPLVQTEQLPDTQFKRVISDRILLEHRFHHIADEVPETSTVKAGLVINVNSANNLRTKRQRKKTVIFT